MARLTGVDVSVFNIGGADLLADLKSAEVISTTSFVDATPVVSAGAVREPVKQNVAIKGALLSSKGGGIRVTHLDVSALLLASADFRPVVREALFEGTIQHEETSGIGDEWAWPVAVQKDYRAKFLMAVDTESSAVLVDKAFGALSGKAVPISLVINGITITLTLLLAKFEHKMTAGQVQTWEVSLVGSASVSGAYPASPTGNATLLAYSFNSPGVPLAIEANGYLGDFLVKAFGFRFSSGSAVESWYDFASQGAVS